MFAALVADVGVGEYHQRRLLFGQVHRHGLIAGHTAVVTDPSAEIEDPQPVCFLLAAARACSMSAVVETASLA